jgi:serine/threonine protein kinase
MLEPSYCPRCHHPLADNAPAGLCPNCLLQLALEPSTAALDPSGNRYGRGSTEYSIPTALPFDIQSFGDYELLELIGRGGMGVIYRARQLSLNRIVALKMMRTGLVASEAEAGRFRAEAEAIASLQHPNIVAIHEVGECEGQLYFSMDYVEGQSLAASIRAHPLSAENAARQVKTIAEAIQYAHEKGILHRDLKPSNILLDQTGQPRVTDFGLAKRMAGGSRLTATGDVLGTPSYMPPEQASGKIDQLGPASDVYSLGAILYELLTGRPPFLAATPLDTVLLALKTEPITPRRLVRGLNRDLETICLKCLEKEPRRRYQSAQDLEDDLGRFLRREPVKARRINPINRSWRWCRRNPWPTVAAAALVLLALIATFSAINSRNRLWRSLVDQVRLERLAGNREKSMRSIAEAARIKQSAELQEEAIQTIIAPDLRLLHQIPVGSIGDLTFSPNSKMLAISGGFSVKIKEENSPHFSLQTVSKLATWEMPSGRPIVGSDRGDNGVIAFNPQSTLLASSEGNRVSLFDSTTGTETALPNLPFWGVPLSGPPIFSPDGNFLVKTMGRLRGDGASPKGKITVKENGKIPEKEKADNFIWIFNARNRNEREIRTEVNLIRFLSNKDLLVAGAKALERYDLETGQSHKLASSEMEVLSVSANGQVAALRSRQPNRSKNITLTSYILWDTVVDKQISVFSAAAGADSQILLSADGRFGALYDPDQPNMLRLWERAGAEFKQRLIALGATSKIYLNRSGFNADGSLLAAFGTDGGRGNVWIWDTQTGSEVACLRDHHSPIWSENGRLLATRGPGFVTDYNESKYAVPFADQTGRKDVTINIEAKTGGSLKTYASLDDGITMDNSLAFVWEVTAPLATYQLPNQINSLSFSPDGNRMVANNVMWDVAKIGDRTLLRPTAQKLPGRYAFFGHAGRLWSADLQNVKDQPNVFPNPQGGMWQSLKLWLVAPEEIEIVLNNEGYSGLIFGPVRISYQNNHRVYEQGSHKATDIQPYALAISPDFKFLALACGIRWEAPDHSAVSGGVVELWDLATQKRLKILNNDLSSGNTTDIRISSVRFSPDGKFLAVGQIGSAGFFIDIATGKKHGPKPDLFEGIFSPNSRSYYSSLSIGDLRVHDVETGAQTDFPTGQHQGEASAVAISARAISADGNWFALGGIDKKICLWNLNRKRQSACWTAHQTSVTAMAFSPDGQTLVSGGADGRLILWNLKFIAQELSALGLGIEQ